MFLSFSHRFVSRRVIFLKDLIFLIIALVVAYLLRFNFALTPDLRENLFHHIIGSTLVAAVSFLIFKPYAGIIRHTGIEDVLRLAKSFLLILVLLLALNWVSSVYPTDYYPVIPLSVLIIYLMVGAFMLLVTRLAVKLLFMTMSRSGEPRENILIFGAGQAGITTCNVISNDKNSTLKVVGFIDENPLLIGKVLMGAKVYKPSDINEDFLNNLKVKDIIFSVQNIDADDKRNLIEDLIARAPVVVREIPPVGSWINGELTVKQINKVKIEDLLQRQPIQLDKAPVLEEIRNKVVLVTGAAGSIGSELSRQLCRLGAARLVFLDQAESPLYDLQQELKVSYPSQASKFEFVIGDVSNAETVERVFRIHKPHLVYHAAAYKHVPLMEQNPFEAVRVNVFGTRLVANTASKYRVQKFVMISTDKAVNPSNVMGASKRVAEIYIQSLNLKKDNRTAFITTRFGNVLGSNGSVIPLFERQIAKGGPVTVTHPDIIRYFMTIPEACSLVFDAGAMGMGGEIFLFDMGNPVKINDLAINMIRLSGLKPGKDIKIEYTGLRPGEKLYEELLNDGENNLPTHNKKITIAQVRHYPPYEVDAMFLDLEDSFNTYDRVEVVAQLKRIVPEFRSNNSEYQLLDRTA
ncbi:MAG: polysaccharide biosynthesis protein [Lentimicrobiaceae bacterium]|nr:polysaccharide biosynthesis protein [Lentimicrobiaceae bacterium]